MVGNPLKSTLNIELINRQWILSKLFVHVFPVRALSEARSIRFGSPECNDLSGLNKFGVNLLSSIIMLLKGLVNSLRHQLSDLIWERWRDWNAYRSWWFLILWDDGSFRTNEAHFTLR